MSTYRERRLARAERLREWAEKRARKSEQGFGRAHSILSMIPMGQPILVGHHSERRHRRDLAKADAGMRAGVENQQMAASMESRANEIEHQADRAIYDDDPDAIDRLTEKLATLEAERASMTAANKAYRKGDQAYAAQQGITIERAAAIRVEIKKGYSWCQQPYPAYSLSNLGGTITKTRQRLARLTAAKTSRGAGIVAPGESDALARAGLTIDATETHPAKAWKKPRPVWNIGGNLAFWRPLLVKAGASEYHGVVSFWDDPSELIAGLVDEYEQQQREAVSPANQEGEQTVTP